MASAVGEESRGMAGLVVCALSVGGDGALECLCADYPQAQVAISQRCWSIPVDPRKLVSGRRTPTC